jgi:hypothetical protein
MDATVGREQGDLKQNKNMNIWLQICPNFHDWFALVCMVGLDVSI